jgi:hypothetical protein
MERIDDFFVLRRKIEKTGRRGNIERFFGERKIIQVHVFPPKVP